MNTTTKEKPKAKKAKTLTSLLERKGELGGIIEAETVRRAAATLDGEAFDPATLKAAQEELQAVEDAEREHARRENVVILEEAAAVRREKAKQALETLTTWLEAIDEQELAARNMVTAAERAEAERHRLQRLVYELQGATPTLLIANEQETRRCRGLSALLHEMKRSNLGSSNALAYGEMGLRPGMFTASDRWSGAEQELAQELTIKLKEILK